MTETDWVAWHEAYEREGSSLARRLTVVQQRIGDALDRAPRGRIRVISICAGQARDILGVLGDHPRRHDVAARLVELDGHNVEYAQGVLATLDVAGVDVVQGDASTTSAYAGAVPADVVLACGIFGNVPDEDIRNTIDLLPRLCAESATVIWTRHRRPPDLTPTIRAWFEEAGFEEVAFDADDEFAFGVGTMRLVGTASPYVGNERLFSFSGDGTAANR